MAGIAFLLGLFVGSFLNVCIWRLPREEQVVRGRSRCPACGQTIRWHDNIPIASFLWLRGRCRACRAPIHWRYPAVELLTGLALAAVALRWGVSGPGLVYAVLLCALIVASFIDAAEQIIPDVITRPGLGLAIAASAAWPVVHGVAGRLEAVGQSLLGAAVGSGAIWLMGLIGRWLFKKEAMGGGDVKLMAMLGALLGWPRILLTFLLAPMLGSLVGIPMKLRRGDELIPYGPFLSLAAVIALWWGDGLIAWYVRQLGGF
ncbi:MAG: prepilin peptidase [Candidatus Omnitrophica bacterium]|nr:prepilin peptidase [Candidatus Omnitrophota bacterium]